MEPAALDHYDKELARLVKHVAARTAEAKHVDAVQHVVDFLRTAASVYEAVIAIHKKISFEEAPAESESVNHDFSQLLKTVVYTVQRISRPPAIIDSQEDLRKACIKVGHDLVVHLERLGVTNESDGVVDVTQFCAAWPYPDVAALGSRLLELRQEWLDIEDLQCSTGQHSLVPGEPADLFRQETLKALKDGKRNDDSGFVDVIHAEEPSKETTTQTKRNSVSPTLLNDFILDSLFYKSMYDRENEVTEAHGKTLEWVFGKPNPDNAAQTQFKKQFQTWLSTNDLGPIYWMTGKPGSGKSTFMRFLSQHSGTMKHLHSWSEGESVVTAAFFFWTSGSKEQRSQTGLLRSLLHQLLSELPHLISASFPELWEKLKVMTTKERIKLELEWTVSDLMTAFHSLRNAALAESHLCLFIDGLDEFDGDHVELINFFKNLGTGKSAKGIKMCLSSRPWSVFEQAFEQKVPSQRLQDLTYQDMYHYSRDNFSTRTYLRNLLQEDPEFMNRLIDAVVQRADGVFLWTRLVVQKLLEASRPISELFQLLDEMPIELDDLFNKLLFKDQTESHISDTAVIFQLLCARESVSEFIQDDSAFSLTVWELAFAIHPEDDDLAIRCEVHQATNAELEDLWRGTVKFVMQRFARLLAMHPRPRMGNMRLSKKGKQTVEDLVYQKITYCHRTVRDWIMQATGVRDSLDSKCPSNFDPHLRLLRSYVLRLKYPLEEVEHHRRLDEWYPDIALALSHARYICNDPDHVQHKLVNELDATLTWYWLSKDSDQHDHWARSAFGAYEVRMKAPPIRNAFLCLATKFGLTGYVSLELDRLETSEDDGLGEKSKATPLLAYATEFLCSRNKTIFPLSDPRLVEYLLSHPSKLNPGPNEEFTDFNSLRSATSWLTLLRHLRDARRRGWIEYYDTNTLGTERWASIVRMFVEMGGADPRAVVRADGWDPEISALGVIQLLEQTYGAFEVRDLRLLLEEKLGDGVKQNARVVPKISPH